MDRLSRRPQQGLLPVLALAGLLLLARLTVAQPGEPPLAGTPGADRLPARPDMVPADTPLPPGALPPSTYPQPAAPGAFRAVADPAPPVVRLRIRVPAEVAPGERLKYVLTVENASSAAAHHVTLQQRLPRGVRLVAEETPEKPTRTAPGPTGGEDLFWELKSLGPGARKEITVVVQPDPGTGDLDCQAYVHFEHGQAVRTKISKPGLQVRVIAPQALALHKPAEVRIEVVNTGKARANDVVVSAPVPEGLTILNAKGDGPGIVAPSNVGVSPLKWEVKELGPGERKVLTYDAATLKAGKFTALAEAVAAGGVQHRDSAAFEVVSPRVKIEVTGPRWQRIDTPAQYWITVYNPGPVTATGVEVVDQLPPDVAVAAAREGQVRDGRVTWSMTELKPGDRRTVQLTVRPTVTGKLTNVAQAMLGEVVADRAETTTRFVYADGPAADVDGVGRLEVGRSATLRVRVYNPGGGPLGDVVLSVRIPDGLRLLDARGPAGATTSLPMVHFGALRSLLPNQEATYTLQVQADKPSAAVLEAHLTTSTRGARPQNWNEPTTVVDATPAPPLAKP